MKATWFDGRLQVNATVYQMEWGDTQMPIADPAKVAFGAPYNSMVANVGDATIEGFDLDVKAILGENLEIGFSLNDTTKAELKAITSVPDERAVGPDFEVQGQIPLGLAANQQLPLYPDQSWSAYIEYSQDLNWFGGGNGYARLQHSDTSKSNVSGRHL